jgi:predicted peroxiredoxin
MTPEQHAAATMIYVDLAAQLDWPRGSGLKHPPWIWHQLMLAAFAEEMGWDPLIMPGLNGGMVVTFRTKQSRLTQRQGSDLIEFAKAWAIDNGVQLNEPENER